MSAKIGKVYLVDYHGGLIKTFYDPSYASSQRNALLKRGISCEVSLQYRYKGKKGGDCRR